MKAAISKLLAAMRQTPKGVRFVDAQKVAEAFFGEPRTAGSHYVYKTPWPGDPRVNLQKTKNGEAKSYQIKQLLTAIDQLNTK
jgi:hypothetical protein